MERFMMDINNALIIKVFGGARNNSLHSLEVKRKCLEHDGNILLMFSEDENFLSDFEDLKKIVLRGAKILNMPISEDGAMDIAKRSLGTPRVAGRLLRRVCDFGIVEGGEKVNSTLADTALKRLDVDNFGLDAFDRRYLNCIVKN